MNGNSFVRVLLVKSDDSCHFVNGIHGVPLYLSERGAFSFQIGCSDSVLLRWKEIASQNVELRCSTITGRLWSSAIQLPYSTFIFQTHIQILSEKQFIMKTKNYHIETFTNVFGYKLQTSLWNYKSYIQQV